MSALVNATRSELAKQFSVSVWWILLLVLVLYVGGTAGSLAAAFGASDSELAGAGAFPGAEIALRFPVALPFSERDRHPEMQAQPAFVMAPGKIDGERAGRAAPARARAVAGAQLELAPRIGGVAGIEEDGGPPLGADPMHVLGARRPQEAAADGGVAGLGLHLLHAVLQRIRATASDRGAPWRCSERS